VNNYPPQQNKAVKLVLLGSLITLSLVGVTAGITLFAFHFTFIGNQYNNNYPSSTPASVITVTTTPTPLPSGNGTPQQIDVPAGASQNVLAGDCVDTFDFANIHAKYVVVFDHGPSKRAKITEDGYVVGTATIYRYSGCYSS
jgi:hypothetical protein